MKTDFPSDSPTCRRVYMWALAVVRSAPEAGYC